VLLILGTNKQPSDPKLTNTHSGNLHGLLSVLHQSEWWLAPVRPVTPVKPVDWAGQAGGYNNRTTNIPESLSDFSRPWKKTHPKHNLNGRRTLHKANQNSSKPTKNWSAPTQPKDTRIKQLTRGKSHEGHTPARLARSTGQTSVTWVARDEQNPWVNSSKSNCRSPDSLHGSEQDFGDSRNTSWHSIAKLWSTKTRWIKRNRRISTKNTPNPRTTKTPKSSPFSHGFGRGIKGKRTTKSSSIHSPTNSKEKGLEITPRKSPRQGSENHQKERTGATHPNLEEPRRINYTSQRRSYKV
jgi:hypothetical protein